MAKTKQKLSKFKNKKLSGLLILTTVIVIGIFCYSRTFMHYNDAYNYSNTAITRDLVIKAVENLKTSAPIDPKTGDIYFPQARLYLPAAQDSFKQELIYYYFPGDQNTGVDFSISNKVTLGAVESKAYSAQNIKQLFEQVPHIQACARGVAVSYKKLSRQETEGVLRHAVRLGNGKTLYLYSEDACPELNDTLQLLKNLRSY